LKVHDDRLHASFNSTSNYSNFYQQLILHALLPQFLP